MRRTHLRKHDNILKRMLIHVAGSNLGLLMRKLIGVGTPRSLQGRLAAFLLLLTTLLVRLLARLAASSASPGRGVEGNPEITALVTKTRWSWRLALEGPSTTGC
jgi:hypothetical protein